MPRRFDLSRRRTLAALGLPLLPALPATHAHAQGEWPLAGKPITLVSAYPAGGASDVLGRALAERLIERLKVPVVVENRAGAGGQLAASHVKLQPPDGHTVWIGDVGPFATNMHVYEKLNYDLGRDFVPVARLVQVPVFLVVPATSPFRTLDELVQAARTRPDGLTYGSQGMGLGGHIYGELFKRTVKGRFNHVPYKGSVPGLTDLMAGRIDLMHDNAMTSGPLLADGKLRALAVRAQARMPQFPAVPTMAEAGLGDINHMLWFGAVARAGTPRAAIDRLATEMAGALADPGVQRRFAALGLEAAPQGPDAFGRFLGEEQGKWGRIIRETGIRLQD